MRKAGWISWLLIIVAGIFLLPAVMSSETAQAAETAATVAADKGDNNLKPEFGGQWIWALLSLVFVTFLAYWSTKLLAGKLGNTQAKHIKVAESLCLGPNRHLYLLLINKKVMLVGSSEHSLNLLKEFPEADFYDSVNRSMEERNLIPAGKFADILGPLLKKDFDNSSDIDDSEFSSPAHERLSQGLEKIRAWRRRR